MLGCFLQTKEPLALVTNMDSYFQVTPPDCSLYSQDKFEFPVHKEVLYQTKVMCDMIKSTNVKDYSIDYSKIEIICPSLAKEDLQVIVNFLYTGKIYGLNHDKFDHIASILNKLFGFPSIFDKSNDNQQIQHPNYQTSNSLNPKSILKKEVLEGYEGLKVIKEEIKEYDYYEVVSTFYLWSDQKINPLLKGHSTSMLFHFVHWIK